VLKKEQAVSLKAFFEQAGKVAPDASDEAIVAAATSAFREIF
jgi:hypothetical protein